MARSEHTIALAPAEPPIPFNPPGILGNEVRYLHEALARQHLAGDGHSTNRCQRILEKPLGVPRALLTTSCTHTLEMLALMLDVQAGDEVIVPAFTFVSTVNAFEMRGARPVFADIRPDTLNRRRSTDPEPGDTPDEGDRRGALPRYGQRD